MRGVFLKLKRVYKRTNRVHPNGSIGAEEMPDPVNVQGYLKKFLLFTGDTKENFAGK